MIGQNQLQDLLYQLGATQVKLNSKGTDFIANCPFQQFTHSDGIDRNPSFGISLNHGNKWNCFSCNLKGMGVIYLLTRLMKYGAQVQPLINQYSQYENTFLVSELLEAIQRFSEQAKIDIAKTKFSPVWSESVMEQYKGKIPMYVIDRIGQDLPLDVVLNVARLFTLGYDEENKVLIIPVRDRECKIVGIGRRFIEENKYIDVFGWQKGDYLYGEQFFDNEQTNIYIVEGYFDVWRMYALGYSNVYAVMGNKLTERKAHKIAAMCRNTFIIPDGDEGGKNLLVSVREKLLPLGVSVFVSTTLRDKDPCYYTPDQMKIYIDSAIRMM